MSKRDRRKPECAGDDPDGSLDDPSRRDFLKTAGLGTAAVVTGTAIAPGTASAAHSPLKTDGATKTITVCPFCGVGCGQIAYTEGNKLLHVEGDPDHPISEGTLCSKGAALSQVTNNPRRLRQVMYRAPGSSKFEPRSWEWAFARIAERVKATRDASFQTKSGEQTVNRTEAIACLGGAALDNEECYLLVKAMRTLGITYIEHQARI
ncbi:MAG: twin-arginine translocation signal domain-containing protein [Deltaproteobacteria bacterium]|nr:twin-arginine translocation signal domain-containing protein [Deltaproteobacteria bacterium]MBW2578365.1 twin-arginine translocation signal domain-containing protein [Deltaproteobacteria bacterium]